jgi:hypothetical protein
MFENYLKCSEVCTPIKDLHHTVDIVQLQEYFLQISARFYAQCTAHINPLVANIGHYEKSDLTQHVQTLHTQTTQTCLAITRPIQKAFIAGDSGFFFCFSSHLNLIETP